MSISRKKAVAAIAAVAIAATSLFGGTLAWQSINQRATNIVSDTVNPGGRLHDDFDGSNKDVYVENFAEEPIYARIRLSEYLQLGSETPVDDPENPAADIMVIANGDIRYFETPADKLDENGKVKEMTTYDMVDLFWGGSTVYMPTFNLHKDSLEADINGSYFDVDADGNSKPYAEYRTYTVDETAEHYEVYDADFNTVEEFAADVWQTNPDNETPLGDVIEADNTAELDKYPDNLKYTANMKTHTAEATNSAQVMSMADWIAKGSPEGAFWVYDTDGWAYWAQAIEPGWTYDNGEQTERIEGVNPTTGLLLDRINTKIDDNYYYELIVTAQFVTANDLGWTDGTGFYDTENGSVPSEDALALLAKIGVMTEKTFETANDAASLNEALTSGGSVILDADVKSETAVDSGAKHDGAEIKTGFNWTQGGTLSSGVINDESAGYAGLFITGDTTEAEVRNVTVNSNSTFGVLARATNKDVTLTNVAINGETGGLMVAYDDSSAGTGTVYLNNCTVNAKGSGENSTWNNTAIGVDYGAKLVVNGGTYTGQQAVFSFNRGGSVVINDGFFNGELKNGAGAGTITVKGGTFTADPTAYVDTSAYEVKQSAIDGNIVYIVTEKAEAEYAATAA